jgi:uncharacterized protein YjiS (DUF1127 family)
MSMIPFSHGRSLNLAGTVRNFAAVFASFATWASKTVSRQSGHWHGLNDHLLRDIGKDPADAELSALEAGMGAAKPGMCDTFAGHGLGADQIKAQMLRDCYRSGN